MLAANKRVASTRIPSHELMYSDTAKARGRHCGKMQTIFLTVSLSITELKIMACHSHHFPTHLSTGLNKVQDKFHCTFSIGESLIICSKVGKMADQLQMLILSSKSVLQKNSCFH